MAKPARRKIGHETSDVNVLGVIWFAMGLVVLAVVMHISLAGLFVWFKHQHPSAEAASRVVTEPRIHAPAPRLQANPVPELNQLRASEEEKLNTYGWIDRQHGVARIPIERAMDLIAERGLPTRGTGGQNSSGKTAEQMRQEKAAGPKP